jgi:hypothetical protein
MFMTAIQTEVLPVMSLFPLRTPGTIAWRQQTGAYITRIHQVTG